MTVNIVLYSPQIPQNTGNISRLCALTNSILHLIDPLGFSLMDKQLKRAGLDYWDYLEIKRHKNIETFLESVDRNKIFFLSSKVEKSYWEESFQDDCYLIFGSESSGLPEIIMNDYKDRMLTIPQFNPKVRCHNLSNSVSIVLYEALRQINFKR
ncbi:MAG: tRNA (cytidine(34)-2'-O)-methyltransferase [Candidatus Sericytochromatia bacterium]